MSTSPREILDEIRSVVELESSALTSLAGSLDHSYVDAIQLLLECKGKVVLTGVGKSGLIARKIAATLNSTGTASAFLHPVDGMHGDLGLLNHDDVVIAVGKSGESEELLRLLPAIKGLGAKIISITSNRQSALAEQSNIVLFAPVEKEACPLDLAPTVSTTVALAVGDALAMTLMKLKGFKSEDFARYHPGGKLGKRLLLRISDLMIPKEKCPILDPLTCQMEDVISALGSFGLGIVLFSSDGARLEGVLTDGDIRRLLNSHRSRIFELRVSDFMNRKPITTHSQKKAVEVLQLMEDRSKPLNVLPIVDLEKIVGVVRLHELVSF
jgi:arabinose-5-phosphate isomerase